MFKIQINYSLNKKKYNSYSEEIEQLVPAYSKVLDVGCTTGKLARALKNKGCAVHGIDIDDASLKRASKYCQKTYRVDVDNLNLLDRELKNEKYDAITFGDILEHLKYPGILLYHLRKYLNPNGLVAASIPNSAFIWTRIRFFLGNFAYSNKGGLMDEDHLRFFSFKTARVLFEDAHYKVLDIHGSSQGIVNPKFWFVKCLAKIVPALFAIHIIILARSEGKNR